MGVPYLEWPRARVRDRNIVRGTENIPDLNGLLIDQDRLRQATKIVVQGSYVAPATESHNLDLEDR